MDSSSLVLATVLQQSSHSLILRVYTVKSIPTSLKMRKGLQRFFKQFSFPGGIGSHATPGTPGSLHEGGTFLVFIGTFAIWTKLL